MKKFKTIYWYIVFVAYLCFGAFVVVGGITYATHWAPWRGYLIGTIIQGIALWVCLSYILINKLFHASRRPIDVPTVAMCALSVAGLAAINYTVNVQGFENLIYLAWAHGLLMAHIAHDLLRTVRGAVARRPG